MGIFQDIERLITEHGSATVLRVHLALAAKKYAVLEKQNAALKESETNLKAENKRLNLNFEECNKQRRELEEELTHKDLPKVVTGAPGRRLAEVNPNCRIEADRRQRRFATLAPSAHGEMLDG